MMWIERKRRRIRITNDTRNIEDIKKNRDLSISIADSTNSHSHKCAPISSIFHCARDLTMSSDRDGSQSVQSLKYCYKLWFMNINAYIFYRLYPLKYYSSISCNIEYIVHRCKRNNEYLSKQMLKETNEEKKT